jgi:hypothetical protein
MTSPTSLSMHIPVPTLSPPSSKSPEGGFMPHFQIESALEASSLLGRAFFLTDVFENKSYKTVLVTSSIFLMMRCFSPAFDLDLISASMMYKKALKEAFLKEDGYCLCLFWQKNAQAYVAFEMFMAALHTNKLTFMQGLFSLPFFLISLELFKTIENTNYKISLFKMLCDMPKTEAGYLACLCKAHPFFYSLTIGAFLPKHHELIFSILEGTTHLNEEQLIELALDI